MDEKKSYGGLVLWLVFFLTATCLCCFLPEAWMLRGIMQLCSLGTTALTGMIYVNEKVYWINGVTFEEALQATTEQRKQYARRHLNVFLWFSVPFFFFSLLSYGLGWSPWIDFTLGCIGLIAAAVSTMSIHLQ